MILCLLSLSFLTYHKIKYFEINKSLTYKIYITFLCKSKYITNSPYNFLFSPYKILSNLTLFKIFSLYNETKTHDKI